jgi:hypothetical protein
MNKSATTGLLVAFLLPVSLIRGQDAAPDELDPLEESFPVLRHPAQLNPFSEALPPEVYQFRMRVPSGTDVTIRTRRVGSEQAKKPGEDNPEGEEPDVLASEIVRRVRDGVVMETTTMDDGSESTRYYLRGWSAFDHPRMGINVRRTSLDGSYLPLEAYTFPELFWAWPERRRRDPEAAREEKPVQIYEYGIRRLEVDAETGLPRRFVDGSMEFLFSYRESQSPIRLPQSLREPVRRVVAKTGGRP